MTAVLHSKGLWMLVNGKKQRPTAPADMDKWDLDQEMAAGLIASRHILLRRVQTMHYQLIDRVIDDGWEYSCTYCR
jgi:hypothetical protein